MNNLLYKEYLSYQEQQKFRKEKLLLRVQQAGDIKKEILRHIRENNKQFTRFMEDLIYLESSGDLYHLDYHYNKYGKLDIIECQMAIFDDECVGIAKTVAFSRYFKSLGDADREEIVNNILGIEPTAL